MRLGDDAKIDPDKSYNKPAFVVGVMDSFRILIPVLSKLPRRISSIRAIRLMCSCLRAIWAPVIVSELYDEKMNPVD